MKKHIIRALMLLSVFFGIILMSSEKPISAASMKLNKTKANIDIEDHIKLKVKNTKKKVTWKSSDASIARVSKKGNVYALKPGTCTITAKVGKKSFTCNITVIDSVAELLDSSASIGNITAPISSKWEFQESASDEQRFMYSIDKNTYKALSILSTPMDENICTEINATEESFANAHQISINEFKEEFSVKEVTSEIISTDSGFIGKMVAPTKINDEKGTITVYMRITERNLILVMVIELGNPSSNTDKIARRVCTDIKSE